MVTDGRNLALGTWRGYGHECRVEGVILIQFKNLFLSEKANLLSITVEVGICMLERNKTPQGEISGLSIVVFEQSHRSISAHLRHNNSQ